MRILRAFCFVSFLILGSYSWQAFCQPPTKLSSSQIKALKKELKKRKSPLLSKESNRKFSRVLNLIDKKTKSANQKSIEILNKILGSTSNNFQKAQAFWFLGITYIGMEDYKKAISNFEKALKIKALSYDRHLNILLILAQLSQGLDKKAEAKEYLGQWFALSDKPQAQPHVLLAYIQYLDNNKDQALKEILKAIKMTKRPDKKWLGFTAKLYIESKKYKEAELILNRLLDLYPGDQIYWKSLSNTYLSQDVPTATVASYQIADKVKKFDEESSIIRLVHLLRGGGQPYKAAKYLEKSIKENKVKSSQKNYEILGDCWRQSEEIKKSIGAYLKSVKLSKDNGKILIKLGQMFYSEGNYKKAIELMENGVKLGQTENPDAIYMQIGWAYHSLKKPDSALKSFMKAIELEGSYELQARKIVRQITPQL